MLIRLLNISIIDFPEIVLSALDTIIYFFDNIPSSASVDEKFLSPLGKKNSCNIQILLIPTLFCNESQGQLKALFVLIKSWNFFPGSTVDSARTGLFYTTLYCVTIINLKMKRNDILDPMVICFLNSFSELLRKWIYS